MSMSRSSAARAISWIMMIAVCVLMAIGTLSGCSVIRHVLHGGPQDSRDASSSYAEVEPEPERLREYVPLKWNVDEAHIVGRQGSTELWGTCGECAIANTLNLATGSAYTEADIVDYVYERGLCVADTGGMSTYGVWRTYKDLLPTDTIDVFWYDDDRALTIDEMADKVDSGILLNVTVYGEMMRNGGHTDEGSIYSTHWIVLHSVYRYVDGGVAGFGMLDSASDATYISEDALSDVYYGHDGTDVVDPTCIEVYGWRYLDDDELPTTELAPPPSSLIED